jgi:cytoskeleton protein RodZ
VNDDSPDGPEEAQAPSPGQILQRERERAGLTVARAAQDLHLDTWVIEAIETNRFSALGAPVFAKGHLRKYAALLGLPAEEVLRRYDALGEEEETPTLIPAAHGTVPARSRRPPGWLLVALALLVIGGIAAWWLLTPGAWRFVPPAAAPAQQEHGVAEPAPPPDSNRL